MNAHRQIGVVAGDGHGVIEETQVDQHGRRGQHAVAKSAEDAAIHPGGQAEIVRVDDDAGRHSRPHST